MGVQKSTNKPKYHCFKKVPKLPAMIICTSKITYHCTEVHIICAMFMCMKYSTYDQFFKSFLTHCWTKVVLNTSESWKGSFSSSNLSSWWTLLNIALVWWPELKTSHIVLVSVTFLIPKWHCSFTVCTRLGSICNCTFKLLKFTSSEYNL